MKKLLLGTIMMALTQTSMATENKDINENNVRAMLLKVKSVAALYTVYNSKNYKMNGKDGCRPTGVKIDYAEQTFVARKTCILIDGEMEGADILVIKGIINPADDSKTLNSLTIKQIDFEYAG